MMPWAILATYLSMVRKTKLTKGQTMGTTAVVILTIALEVLIMVVVLLCAESTRGR